MVQRVSDLIGKPVVAADDGERLGTVSDLLVDETSSHVVAYVIRQGGFMKREAVLPAPAVKTLGRDTVVTSSRADLVDAREWRAKSQTP